MEGLLPELLNTLISVSNSQSSDWLIKVEIRIRNWNIAKINKTSPFTRTNLQFGSNTIPPMEPFKFQVMMKMEVNW